MEFDARDQALALAALPPEPPKPAAPKTSAWSAPFRALPAGVAEVGAMLAESVKGFGQALDATGTAGAGGMFGGQTDAERAQSERTRQQIRTRGLQGGSELSRSLRNVAEGYGPDPLTASKAEQVVFGMTKGVSKAIGYGMTAGPAAPLMFGLDEGLTETDWLQRQGVDTATAAKAGGVAAAVNAAGFLVPVAGKTVAGTIGLGTLSGPASVIAQQAGTREILRAADYGQIAEQFDPLDPVGLGVSLLPFGFGAWAMRARMRGVPDRAPARDQAPADGAAGVADTRPTPEPVRPVEAVPMEPTPVAAAAREATMPREAVDAAMVMHIVDAAHYAETYTSKPIESLAAYAARTLPDAAPRAESARAEADPFLGWLRAQGGVNFADKFDITGESNGIRLNRGGVFKKGGRGLDELAQVAEAEGWLPPGSTADIDGGTPQMRDMIQRAMQGERITPLAEQFASMESRAMAQADEMRAADLENRLRLLGEDPTPARGNVEVLQAYLDQHEPRLLAAALEADASAQRAAAVDDFPQPVPAAAVEPTRPSVQQEQIKSAIGNSGRFDPTSASLTDPIPAQPKGTATDAPTTQELGAQAREAPSPQAQAQATAVAAIEPGSGPDAALIESVRSRGEQVVREAPDLVVGMTEDGQPITAREALERIRQEAQAGTEDTLGAADAGLLDVAVQCALSLGG